MISCDELYEFMSSESNTLSDKIFPVANELLWQVFLSMEDGSSVGEIIMSQWQLNSLTDLESVSNEDKKLKKKILVQNRHTGKLEPELIPSYIRVSMRLMYSSRVGRRAVSGAKIRKILKQMTLRQGRVYNCPNSCKQIQPFIEFHKLNVDEIRDDISSFKNFNEFFYRKVCILLQNKM